MYFAHRVIGTIAQVTRRYKATRFDSFLRRLHNPDTQVASGIQTIITTDNGINFHVNTASYLEWMLFFYGQYEPIIERLIKKYVQPGAFCIDVGANIGIHTMSMALATGPLGRVIAFEPHPIICKKLRQNLTLNSFEIITVEEKALSSAEGTATLYGFDGHDANQGTSSLQALHSNKNCLFSVAVTTLDLCVKALALSRVDFIKIDVEGFEDAVIKGSLETIALYRPIIIFENCRAEPEKTKSCMQMIGACDYLFYEIFYADIRPCVSSDLTAPNILAVPGSIK